MPTTPPFLAWAIERACPFRQIEQWTEPERTERHLRGIVEFARGRQAGRVIEQICLGPECYCETTPLAEQTGFPVEETLSLFGGEEIVVSTCGSCDANVAGEVNQNPLAGCHGLLPLTLLDAWTIEAQQQWHQLCATSHWMNESTNWLAAFSLMAGQCFDENERTALQHLTAAMERCRESALRLHVRMYPAGRIEGRRWILPQHCLACGADWNGRQDRCRYCQSSEPTGGELRRHVRGQRPFVPLLRFLSAEDAERLLQQVRQTTADQQAAARERYRQLQAQSPPRT